MTAEDLTRGTGQPPGDGHDAWIRRQVETRLMKKHAGDVTYSSLDEVAAEFGFDAR
ncbi:hypothetical protein [Hoeflea sp.]|uniref:hypothetical protein n=1 Tax=Hoeflea sp. TaxID=1940281 RepID=UPI00198D99F5|nr:hypothetical protein [Hoeflea sp.]MBC7282476.1 hypothetical protein [Hoeflea sp.]